MPCETTAYQKGFELGHIVKRVLRGICEGVFGGLEPGDTSQEFEKAFGTGCAVSQLEIGSRGFFAINLMAFACRQLYEKMY